MREKIVEALAGMSMRFAEASRGATRGGKAMGWASGAFEGAGRFMSTRNGLGTMAGAAVGGAYGAFSDDTSVLGGMAMGAVAGRYGGEGVRNARAAFRGLRSGVGAMGPVAPVSLGRAFGQASAMGGGSSARLIGSDITKAYNGFKGLFKGGKTAPPVSVGNALSPSRRGGWRDPNSARSVRQQKIARDHASLRARAQQASTPNIVSSARRAASAFREEGQAIQMKSLAGSAAGIPNRAGTVEQGDSLWSLAARDTAR